MLLSLTHLCQLIGFAELSLRPCGGDLWPLAMTSMEMRQLEAGSSELVVLQPPLRSTLTASASSASHSVAHSTDDLSNCGSKLNLLPELEPQNQETRSGRRQPQHRLHYSNPSCDLLPASANTHQQATSIETTFNTVAPQPDPSSSLSPSKLDIK